MEGGGGGVKYQQQRVEVEGEQPDANGWRGPSFEYSYHVLASLLGYLYRIM